MRRGLLDGAAYLREDVVGIRSNEPNGAHNDNQNDRQHDRVFRDVLTFLITPKLL